MKNFHLPLPDEVYDDLKAEADRSRIPTTSMARQAIQAWLKARKQATRNRAIRAYAIKMAGTESDLDRALERATIDKLLESEA